MRRTMLFLPGNTPNMLINGDTLGADTIIFDLEDAVSPDEKDAARVLVRNTLKYQSFDACETVPTKVTTRAISFRSTAT